MSEYLNQELQKGEQGATMLAEHLYMMGAEQCQISTEFNGISYVCNVKMETKKYHLVEIQDDQFPWHAVYGDPIQSKKGIGFKKVDFAKEFIKIANEGVLIKTPLAFHEEDCPGCINFYFSRLKQELIAICNECGLKRELLTSTDGNIYGFTVPFSE